MSKTPQPKAPQKTPDSCPHCGSPLSPWEQVLLGVDRALTCKHCWYRILIDVTRGTPTSSDEQDKKQ